MSTLRIFLFSCLFLGCNNQGQLGEEALFTESGLEYIYLKVGSGIRAEAGNEVLAHCVLKIGDSTVFWSTRADEDPFSFVYMHTKLIPGFQETIGLMRQGDRLKVIIPPELGYGDRGFGELPPDASLSFDIEMLEVRDLMLWVADSVFNVWQQEGPEAGMAKLEEYRSRPDINNHERQLMILGSRLKNDGRLNDWFDIVALRAKQYPNSFSAQFALGSSHEERGEQKLALAAYQEALRVSPENPAALSKVQALQ